MKHDVPLAPLTTFHIGGLAHTFIEAKDDNDIRQAIDFSREQNLRVCPLGAGSNILVPDGGVSDVVLKISNSAIFFEKKADTVLATMGAGTSWESAINAAIDANLWGIENLAGIPGTVGGAVVQNIGAYGAEFSDVFVSAEAIDTNTGAAVRIPSEQAEYGYRTSVFKRRKELVVTQATFKLNVIASPNTDYADLSFARERGTRLDTPREIASAVCTIRKEKFPLPGAEGTAGSFFKNPIVAEETAKSLAMRFDGMPIFVIGNGLCKIPLAWVLDHVLSLKGYQKGNVRLYEKQPIVIVTQAGATATEVDAFACEIATRVREVVGITIEREVEWFGS